jgi:hypothetical protein
VRRLTPNKQQAQPIGWACCLFGNRCSRVFRGLSLDRLALRSGIRRTGIDELATRSNLSGSKSN